MLTIWKYSLEAEDNDVEMPIGAKILDIQIQNGQPQLWALVNSESIKEIRHFSIYGTGHSLPINPGNYIGTFLIQNGTFVYHVFEI